MSEIIPLLNKAPSSNREVYVPTRGGGPAKGGNVDFYTGLKRAAEGSPKEPPEGGYEPGPYGDPVDARHYTNFRGPKEPFENTGPAPYGMYGPQFTVTKGPGGYYCILHNPEADPVGPFATEAEAYASLAPRGNR